MVVSFFSYIYLTSFQILGTKKACDYPQALSLTFMYLNQKTPRRPTSGLSFIKILNSQFNVTMPNGKVYKAHCLDPGNPTPKDGT